MERDKTSVFGAGRIKVLIFLCYCIIETATWGLGIWILRKACNGIELNNKQKKENIHGYEHIQFHLILFPVPQKKDIVNWFVERAKQIKEDA